MKRIEINKRNYIDVWRSEKNIVIQIYSEKTDGDYHCISWTDIDKRVASKVADAIKEELKDKKDRG